MPSITRPKGAKPSLSSARLSLMFKNTGLRRASLPACAKLTVPRLLDCFTGSSASGAPFHNDCTEGPPAMPNCTTKAGRTRQNRESSKNPVVTSFQDRSAPSGAQSRCTPATKTPFEVSNRAFHTAGISAGSPGFFFVACFASGPPPQAASIAAIVPAGRAAGKAAPAVTERTEKYLPCFVEIRQ